MPEIYRETRYTRERDESSSDDDRYKSTTVRRYKVTPNRSERVERIEREVDIDDDRRSRYSAYPGRSSGDLLEVDRRVERTYIPERPRSAADYGARQGTTVVERKFVERDDRDAYYHRDDRDRSSREFIERERVVDRDGDGYADARARTVIERQVIPMDDHFRDDRDRSRTMVYEKTKEVERDSYSSPRDWDRRSNMPWERDDREVVDMRIERRVDERDDRYARPGEIERYRRETEYYEPSPAPIVIRQRAPEQRIILQEAPPPAPVIISRDTQETREIARRPDYRDDEREYRYRREVRDSYGDNRRDEDVAVVARRRRDDRGRRYSDVESEDEYYFKRTIRREESGSPDNHHKLHLAEGALAGAGAAALLASRRGPRGNLPEHRGRKVLAGAALGALGTEVVRRAKSAYDDRRDDRHDDGRGRSRSRSRDDDDHHSRLKTGLGIAAAALAVAGAAKYYQSTKQDKEEYARGRSRHRDAYSDYSRSPSRKRSRSGGVAKAALGTAAVAGLVEHFRNKSKARDGKSRSRSRLRTGAEIVAAGLAGAAAKKLYDRHQEKKEHEDERDVSDADEYYRDDDRRHRSRSRSVNSRSAARTPYPEAARGPADPELGMVEYGAHPLYSDPAPYPEYNGYGPSEGAERGYDSATEGRRRHRRRGGDDSDAETEREATKKRSRSRLRDLATGAAAAGAAAIGIKKYQDSKKEKERSRERSRRRDERDRDGDSDRDADYNTERERERERLRHRRDRDRRRE